MAVFVFSQFAIYWGFNGPKIWKPVPMAYNPYFHTPKVAYKMQIVQLTASGNFEEALALCKLLPPEDSSLRASKEQSIHIR